jgi:glucosylceramidase
MRVIIKRLLILFLGIIFFNSCSKNEFSPINFNVKTVLAGSSVSTPYGDGSGVATFTLTAKNADYYQLYLPDDNQTLTLRDPKGGDLNYTFSKNGGKNTTYIVQASACNSTGCTNTNLNTTIYYAQPRTDVLYWKTNPSANIYFSRQYVGLNFSKTTNANKTITVDTTQTYQKIDGFGFALTGGSATLINGLSPTNKINLLTELFTTDSTNIGVSYLRISIGASDLSDHAFSYDEVAGDSTLQNFSINEEKKDLIPILKQIVQLNPAIKIIATPWSAPAWMKTNGSYYGGSLKAECYDVYARYFVKYIQAMQAEGISIEAVTPQNEPLNAYNNPAMVMQAKEENNFIKNYLAPQFKADNIKTKIIVYDHNLDVPEYAEQILSDATTYNMIDGSAFHLYSGNINTMSMVHEKYPDKNIYFTEQYTASTGNFVSDLQWHIQTLIIGATRNWSKNVIEWNLASDPELGPHTVGGCSTCLGALTISGGSVAKRNVSYYIIAHASKYVRPGAVRISSTDFGDLPNVAFKNADGSKVLVVLNNTGTTQTFNILFNGKIVTSMLEGGAVATYIW